MEQIIAFGIVCGLILRFQPISINYCICSASFLNSLPKRCKRFLYHSNFFINVNKKLCDCRGKLIFISCKFSQQSNSNQYTFVTLTSFPIEKSLLFVFNCVILSVVIDYFNLTLSFFSRLLILLTFLQGYRLHLFTF